jgi:hypothetical protein
MSDAAAMMPPPSVLRPGTSASNRGQPVKRPLKPTTVVKGKPAPTVIRVNTNSSQQSQFHPSNSILSATLQDTFGGPSNQLSSKSSKASLQTKPSLQSLKSSMSSTGRPKALELAARKKEQEEREAQRKRDAKAEMERKRAAQQEEDRRQEQQRRLDAERQREQEKEQASRATEAQKTAQRQAALERAKLTMAPPPALRTQPGGPPQHQMGANRAQEESGRPINAVLPNVAKATQKRPLPQESSEEPARPTQGRNPPSYQKQDVKRMRMSDPAEDDLAMEPQPSMKGPPVRPSAGLRKVCPVPLRACSDKMLIMMTGSSDEGHAYQRLRSCSQHKCDAGSVQDYCCRATQQSSQGGTPPRYSTDIKSSDSFRAQSESARSIPQDPGASSCGGRREVYRQVGCTLVAALPEWRRD